MARHTRYPGGQNWLPEFFKQQGANTHEYRDPTTEEQIAQWVRMYTMRRISFSSMLEALNSFDPLALPIDLVVAISDNKDNEEDVMRDALRPFAGRIYS